MDVAQLPDGSLLISGDYAGALYRIAYEGDEGAMPLKRSAIAWMVRPLAAAGAGQSNS